MISFIKLKLKVALMMKIISGKYQYSFLKKEKLNYQNFLNQKLNYC